MADSSVPSVPLLLLPLVASDVGPATAVLFGFVVIATLASWQWHRVDYRYGAEWLLRKLAA